VQVNLLAVFLAAASTMVVGSVWYTPAVFGKRWKKLVGMTDEKAAKGAGKAIAITVVVSLISAYILAHVTYLSNAYFGNEFLQDALTTSFWAWLGFVAARIITHDAFEQRPTELTVMNVGHEFVTFMIMGLIIGLFGV
jgi:Protein of unknown function (DUF1761)